MTNGDLFVPHNLLEVCHGMQEAIASVPGDEQDQAGSDARDVIGPNVSYLGENKLEVRTLGAFALPDGLTFDSELWPSIEFGELRLCATLAQVAYLRINSIRTLAWMMVDSKIRESEHKTGSTVGDHELAAFVHKGDTLRRPLYLPVGMIESVMIAA